jgi:hypothetical protein
MVWAKPGHALGHGSAGDLAQTHHIFEAEPSACEPLWAIREPAFAKPTARQALAQPSFRLKPAPATPHLLAG